LIAVPDALPEEERTSLKDQVGQFLATTLPDLAKWGAASAIGATLAGRLGLSPVGTALMSALIAGTLVTTTDYLEGKTPAPLEPVENVALSLLGTIPFGGALRRVFKPARQAVQEVFDRVASNPEKALSLGGEGVLNTPKPISGYQKVADKVVEYLRKPLEARIFPVQLFGESWKELGERSLAELFEPAVRRLRKEVPELGERLTYYQVARSELNERTKDLMLQLARLRDEGNLGSF
jgi:hypothetical protein